MEEFHLGWQSPFTLGKTLRTTIGMYYALGIISSIWRERLCCRRMSVQIPFSHINYALSWLLNGAGAGWDLSAITQIILTRVTAVADTHASLTFGQLHPRTVTYQLLLWKRSNGIGQFTFTHKLSCEAEKFVNTYGIEVPLNYISRLLINTQLNQCILAVIVQKYNIHAAVSHFYDLSRRDVLPSW